MVLQFYSHFQLSLRRKECHPSMEHEILKWAVKLSVWKEHNGLKEARKVLLAVLIFLDRSLLMVTAV